MSDDRTMIIHHDEQGLRVCGRVDMQTSPSLLKALRHKPHMFRIDLAGVSYMDSAGIATLIEALRLAQREQQELLLAHLPDCVYGALQLAGVESLFNVKTPSTTEA